MNYGVNEIRLLQELPTWARKIVHENESTRTAAYFYRQQAVSFRVALHDLLKNSKRDFEFYDKVCKKAEKVFAELDEMRTLEELEVRAKVRAKVISLVNQMIRNENKKAIKAINEKKEKKGTK